MLFSDHYSDSRQHDCCLLALIRSRYVQRSSQFINLLAFQLAYGNVMRQQHIGYKLL